MNKTHKFIVTLFLFLPSKNISIERKEGPRAPRPLLSQKEKEKKKKKKVLDLFRLSLNWPISKALAHFPNRPNLKYKKPIQNLLVTHVSRERERERGRESETERETREESDSVAAIGHRRRTLQPPSRISSASTIVSSLLQLQSLTMIFIWFFSILHSIMFLNLWLWIKFEYVILCSVIVFGVSVLYVFACSCRVC